MDFSYTDEEQAIGDLALQVLSDASEPAALRALERSDAPRFDRSLWSTLADTGVLGATLPDDLPGGGGAGLGLVALGRLCDAVGATAAAVPLWETLALGSLPVGRFAPAAVRDRWLDRVAEGDAVLTAAWHEDGGDPLRPTTLGEERDGVLSVTGTKSYVPAGVVADAVVVPARVGDDSALVLIETAAEGVTVEPLTTTAASPDALLRFDGAVGTVIARGDEALRWAYERAVATQCAAMTGGAATALAITATYTVERKQFDTPIATFQAVAHRAADAFIDTEGIRLTTAQALWRLDANMDASAEVAIAKYWAADAGQRVVHAAMHLHGGTGVDRDYPVHRYFLQMKERELQLGGTSRQLVALGALIADGRA